METELSPVEEVRRERSQSLPASPGPEHVVEPASGGQEKPRRLSDLFLNLVSRGRGGSLPDVHMARRGSHHASVGSGHTTAGYSTGGGGSVSKTVGVRRNSFQVNPVDAQVLVSYERLLHEQHPDGARFSFGGDTPGRLSNLGLPAPPPLRGLDEEYVVEKKAPEDLTEPNCFICLGKFTQKKPAVQIPCVAKCNLAPVHARCIYEWKEQRSSAPTGSAGSCPLCRSALASLDYNPPDPLATKTLFMHSARRSFVSRPSPKAAGMVRAYVRVTGGGALTGTPIRYEMYLQAPSTRIYPNVPLPPTYGTSEGDQLLMTAKRRISRKTGCSVIDISLDRTGKDFSKSGPNYLADVRGTLFGLDYTVTAPCRFDFQRDTNQILELGSVRFEQNRIGSGAGPRRISICLPAVREDPAAMDPWPPSSAEHQALSKKKSSASSVDQAEEDDEDDDDDELDVEVYRTMEYVPQSKRESLRRVVRSHPPAPATSLNSAPAAAVAQVPTGTPPTVHIPQLGATVNGGFSSDQFIFARNRKPYYLESIAAFSLDFFGRVTLPSNKNCLLASDETNSSPESNLLLFGKIGVKGKNADATVYTLDFQWPLSPLQAFGIALASCDRKFGCA